MALKRETRLLVDFNELDSRRRVVAHLFEENAAVKLEKGQEAVLYDLDGNRAQGVVATIRGGDAVIDVAWHTWQSPRAVRVSPKSSLEQDLFRAAAARIGRMGTATESAVPSREKRKLKIG